MRTEIKIFSVVLGLSLTVFLVTFAVGLPLIYEHRLGSSRLSSQYIVNFFESMSVYFFLAAVLAVVIYTCVKPMSVEAKIFIITLVTVFWAYIGIMPTVSLYYGNRGDPLRFLTMWGYRFAFIFLYYVSLLALIPATLAVIIYKMYGFFSRRRKPE